MENQGFVKKAWDTQYVTEALDMSRNAWDEYVTQYGRGSTMAAFLSQKKNFFLVGAEFRRKGDTVLVASPDVGDKWGVDDFMVDFSSAAAGSLTEQEWLELAASFGGNLYLVGVNLSNREVEDRWWFALAHSSTSSPNSLFILFDFGSGRCENSGDHLLRILYQKSRPRKNNPCPNVKNVVVYYSNLSFSADPLLLIKKVIPLDTLHLEKVRISEQFLSALSSRKAFDVSNTLSLINIDGKVSHPVSDYFDIEDEMMECLKPHEFLKWQLRHLNLIGFFSAIELVPFMESLGQCKNISLCSVSLQDSVRAPGYIEKSTFLGVVIDALHNSGLQFLNLGGLEEDPAIQAQLLRNRHSPTLGHPTLRKLEYSKVPAVAMRLFTCGDAYAGKTTLLSTLCTGFSRPGFLDKLSEVLRCHSFCPNTLERTRGIEIRTISRHGIHLSVWDMAGQTEFHAFHDHMFPDPSISHGSPAMFMFVWSPMDSMNEGGGKAKPQHEFESSFRYWLKFITSKTRQSNILRKVIVVLTRKDQTKCVRDALEASIHALSTTFINSIQVVDVLEVDARSEASLEPLVSCIFRTAHDILEGVEVYSICSQVSEYLSKRHNRKSLVGEQPIISWNDFSKLCIKQFKVTDPEVQKAIAYSLNESGDIIYLSNLPFLVLDPNWFCHEVMGSLIYFPQPQPGINRVILPINGYAKQDYLEKVLKESSGSSVEGSVLLALMEAMHLCCKVPGDPHGMIFIPATLLDSDPSRHLRWRGALGGRSSMQEYVYVGRRLECDKNDLTFLTPGLFPTIQVAFNKAFCEWKDDMKLGKADVQRGKGFMSICVLDSEIIMQWGLAKGDHVIDVMIRAPDDDDVGHTLVYVEDKIIRTVIGVCAQPVGNQGVRLVESVIRPDCLHDPSPPQVRADQCALILDLKQELKEQLEAGRRHEKLLHLWEAGNNHLQPVTSHFIDLLGHKEFMKVLMSYKASLEEVSLISVTATAALMEKELEIQSASTSGKASQEVGGKALMQEDINAASTSTSSHVGGDKDVVRSSTSSHVGGDKDVVRSSTASHAEESARFNVDGHEQVVDALSNRMVKEIYRKMSSIGRNFKENVESQKMWNLSVDGKLEGITQRLDPIYKSIVVDLRSSALQKVQKLLEQSLNFAVENEAGKIPRFVFLTTDDTPGAKRRMVTAFVRGLKRVRIELFCEHREGPHRVDGQKGLYVSTVDDGAMITRALPYVNGFLKVLTLVAKVGAHVFAGAGSTIPDLSQLLPLAMDTPGFLDNKGILENVSMSPGEDFNGWQQWLVSTLEKYGGMKESNISSKFMLKRALYKDTSKVAWLCDMHYKDQCPLPLV